MIPWKLVHLWIAVILSTSLIVSLFSHSWVWFAVSYGLGLGWLNLFSLAFLGKSLRHRGKLQSWYFPLWLVKWLILGALLYLALKVNLSPLGLIAGFMISLVLLAILSVGSFRNVLHSRSS